MIFEGMALLTLAAQGVAPGGEVPRCTKARAERGAQSDLNICAHAEFRKADAALNRQWRRTAAHMKQLDAAMVPHDDGRASYFETLLRSQRAWLAYRDSHCANEGYLARGGTMEPMLVSLCLTQLTRERTKQLRQLAEYPE